MKESLRAKVSELPELDLDQFWQDNQAAEQNNCFNDGSKVALGIRMSEECIFDELGIKVSHPWDPQPRHQMQEWVKRYNDKAEQVVGRRMLREEWVPEQAEYPQVKRIGEVFGGRYVWQNHTEWLEQSVDSYQQLEQLLDHVDRMDMREFMLPDHWEAEKKRIQREYGTRPPLLRHIRGPVTLACSILGSQELIYLIIDEPDLAKRFSNSIADAILRMAQVLDEEAGVTPEQAPGFSFADDNCCLLNPEMYELFGLPVLEKVFARYAPRPEHSRYQHSDSDMGHLLPLLGKTDLTGVNFGPNVLVPEIRRYLPRARIDGCIAPFAFSRNDEAELFIQTRRDCLDGLRYGGVNIATAGSINYGSSLQSLRLMMQVIQQYGRS